MLFFSSRKSQRNNLCHGKEQILIPVSNSYLVCPMFILTSQAVFKLFVACFFLSLFFECFNLYSHESGRLAEYLIIEVLFIHNVIVLKYFNTRHVIGFSFCFIFILRCYYFFLLFIILFDLILKGLLLAPFRSEFI